MYWQQKTLDLDEQSTQQERAIIVWLSWENGFVWLPQVEDGRFLSLEVNTAVDKRFHQQRQAWVAVADPIVRGGTDLYND